MASLEELKIARLAKLDMLVKAGMEVYPAKVPRDFSLKNAKDNFAEYEAVILGFEALAKIVPATKRNKTDVVVKMDSELVVKQINGEYRVKNADIKPLFEKAIGALKNFKSFEIRHIDRSKNKEADKLVNKAINLSSLLSRGVD